MHIKTLMKVLIIAILFSCNSNSNKNVSNSDNTNKPLAENRATVSNDPNSNPVSVMNTIVNAAKTGEVGVLHFLIPPYGEGEVDGDCKALCNPGNESMRDELGGNYITLEQFRSAFAKCKIVGTPEISGDQASVNFVFGPNLEYSETMKMQRINGKWYLGSY